jgi:hypothetical protein
MRSSKIPPALFITLCLVTITATVTPFVMLGVAVARIMTIYELLVYKLKALE